MDRDAKAYFYAEPRPTSAFYPLWSKVLFRPSFSCISQAHTSRLSFLLTFSAFHSCPSVMSALWNVDMVSFNRFLSFIVI